MAHKSNHKEVDYTVEKATELLPFLFEVLTDTGRNSVKSILKRGQVLVDDHTETQHNHPLKQGQKVTIVKNKVAKRKSGLTGIHILHEDEQVIVIDKSPGLLSIASAKENQMTAHHQLMNYVKQQNPKNRIFIVHRLDRDTSGVMVFAKTESAKEKLQKIWKESVDERTYSALVEGRVKKETGTISSYLRESHSSRKVHSSSNPAHGKHAVTNYKVIQTKGKCSLLEVQLETGRKNQIRVHMQEIGYPITGDKKYRARTNPLQRLGLHAKILAFKHPVSGKIMRFESPVPKAFFKAY